MMTNSQQTRLVLPKSVQTKRSLASQTFRNDINRKIKQIIKDEIKQTDKMIRDDVLVFPQTVVGNIKKEKRLGATTPSKESKYGEAYQISIPVKSKIFFNNKSFKAAIKIIPIKPRYLSNNKNYSLDLIISLFFKNRKYQNENPWNELYITYQCSEYVSQGYIQNLPVLYDYLVVRQYNFTNRNLIKQMGPRGPALVMFTELYNYGTLADFTVTTHRFQNVWMNIFFQIYYALFFVMSMGYLHLDAHWNNILIQKVPPGGYWIYQIANKNYYIKNLGYICILWDFGWADFIRSTVVDKDSIPDFQRVPLCVYDALKPGSSKSFCGRLKNAFTKSSMKNINLIHRKFTSIFNTFERDLSNTNENLLGTFSIPNFH